MNNRENAMAGKNLGWRLETVIYIELLRRFRPIECDIYYFDDPAGEADFLICEGKEVKQIIQVCYDISEERTFKREKKGLFLASQKTGCNNLLLLTDHDNSQITENGKTINIVPAYAWLTEN